MRHSLDSSLVDQNLLDECFTWHFTWVRDCAVSLNVVRTVDDQPLNVSILKRCDKLFVSWVVWIHPMQTELRWIDGQNGLWCRFRNVSYFSPLSCRRPHRVVTNNGNETGRRRTREAGNYDRLLAFAYQRLRFLDDPMPWLNQSFCKANFLPCTAISIPASCADACHFHRLWMAVDSARFRIRNSITPAQFVSRYSIQRLEVLRRKRKSQ